MFGNRSSTASSSRDAATAAPREEKAPRRVLSHRAGFWLVGVTLGLLVAASAAPSPIFPVYQAEWGLGPTAVTLVFAVYAGALLVALLTVGSLSDHLGRRPVLLAGVLGVVVAMGLFVVADSVGWLVLARIVQGVSTGTAIGALGAALLDLAGPRRAALAQLVNGATPPIGLTLGAVGAGALVQFGPEPTRLVYVVLAAALVLIAIVLTRLPAAVEKVPGALASLKPVLHVPPASRATLAANAPAFIGSWALGGLFLGLGASIMAQVLGRTDHLVSGLVVASVAGVGAVVGIVTRNVDPHRVVLVGSVAFLVGPAIFIVAVSHSALPQFFVAAAVSGIGFGAGFQGGLRAVLATAPAHERAGVLSAVYVMSYLAFGVPAVVAGFFAPTVGLAEVAEAYAALVIVLGAVSLVLSLRTARTRARAEIPAPRCPVADAALADPTRDRA